MSPVNGDHRRFEIWIRGDDPHDPAGPSWFGQTPVYIYNLSNPPPGTIHAVPPPGQIIHQNIGAAARWFTNLQKLAVSAQASENGVLPHQFLPELPNGNVQS
jgi:hypothetical protein